VTPNDLWYNCDLMITVKKKSWLFGAFILAWLLLALPAGAQTEADRLSRVQVDLWPDYDQPAVLVLITIELPAELALPATVDLKLPAPVSQPSAVANITADGQMFDTSYQTEVSGENTLLRVSANEPIVRVEYYYPYERDGNAVQFTYNWLGGTAVDDLTILVQEPAQATSFASAPSFEDIGILADGRHYYQWQAGALGKDATRLATVSYVAPSSSPSADLSPAAPSSSSDDGESVIIPILTALGGLLIGIGIGWYLANRRAPVRKSSPQRKAIHCHQCGSRLRAGDSFCRQCGTKTR